MADIMNIINYLLLTLILIGSKAGQAGFVSSNGMSRPVGIICQESENSQIQVKLDLTTNHFQLRRVTFRGSIPVTVTNLTEPMICEESRTSDEPSIENHCTNFDLTHPSTLIVTPARDRIFLLAQSPLIDGLGQLWFDFPSHLCVVELDENISP
jgi:hypothetical protein